MGHDNTIRLWIPRDPAERRRIVEVLWTVWSDAGCSPNGEERAQRRRLGAIVRETDRRLPGVAYVEFHELWRVPRRR